MDSQVKVASGLNVLFGLWLIISPFVMGFSALSTAAMWDAIIVGIIVAVLAAIRFFNTDSSSALSWINALLGIWMIISPWIFGVAGMTGALWDFIIVGIAFLVFGVWSALATPATPTAHA